jgi:amino acid transporter
MPEPADRPAFIRSLGLWDVVLMNVVAVVGLRWIARGARVGPPSVTLWILACVLFFVPLAAALAELSSRHPDQGGLYVWTRRAMGHVHGFICGWCLWVNNLFYFPSLLLFAAANALLVFGERFAHLADSRVYSLVFVLGALWAVVGINIVGLSVGKWLQNFGSIGVWATAGLLIGSGAFAFAAFGSATSFTLPELVPTGDSLATLSLWSAMCFAFSGFEITGLVGQEVKRPTRTIPLGVIIAGAATTAIYVLGSASVLVAVPASALAERSGIADAVEIVGGRVGLAGLGGLIGLLLTLNAFAGVSSWVAGAARVPFAAGLDAALPRVFARMHPRYRTPHVALIVEGIVSSLIFLLSVFLTVAGRQTTVQEAYDIMVNLTILIYFIPYLYLFIVLVKLRRTAGAARQPGEIRIPGGTVGLWLVAGSGLLATAVSLLLVFVPPAGTENVLNYEANLLLQSLGILVVGLALYYTSHARRAGA